jgi:hypothetical protein
MAFHGFGSGQVRLEGKGPKVSRRSYTAYSKTFGLADAVQGNSPRRIVNTHYPLYCIGFTLAVVFLGSVIFNRVEQTFMDTV